MLNLYLNQLSQLDATESKRHEDSMSRFEHEHLPSRLLGVFIFFTITRHLMIASFCT